MSKKPVYGNMRKTLRINLTNGAYIIEDSTPNLKYIRAVAGAQMFADRGHSVLVVGLTLRLSLTYNWSPPTSFVLKISIALIRSPSFLCP